MSVVEEIRPPRKRSLSDDGNLTNTALKKALVESEQEKINHLRRIDTKMDTMLDLLGQIVNLNKLQSTTSQHQIHTYSIIITRL